MRLARHLLVLIFAAWATATPAGVVGTGLRGSTALANIGGALVFALPFCIPALLLGVAAYFIARRAGANPLLIGAVAALCVNAFAFYEMTKLTP